MSDLDLGIRVELEAEEAVVHETLERMGIVNKKDKIIFPSCYLRQLEDESWAVVHFKELFALQDKPSTFDELDELRRATIVYFLQKWHLVSVKEDEDINNILKKKIDVIPFKDKHRYKIKHKFRYDRQ